MSHKSNSNPLWTKDFTIITLGSAVSMLGNALSGFSMSLLVLDYTKSSMLYAVFIAVFTLPQIIMPIFSGAVLDRFSRRKAIYTLDFISAFLYAAAAVMLYFGWFNFAVLAVACFMLGSINSIYTVAYQSFYPMLISEGNYSKAYSLSSLLETLSAIMVPISAFAYNLIGIAPLLAINAVSFLIAAITETQITAREEYAEKNKDTIQSAGLKMMTDIKEGFSYLLREKGLLAVAVYFTFSSFSGGAAAVITLPFFKATYDNGEYIYMLVWGMALLGRAIGGAVHYRIKLPVKMKFAIALTVYIFNSFIEGFYLYFSIPVMMGLFFVNGILGVTSYTIRISATQSYVPDEKKGRFNGAFNMLNTAGSLSGELSAGALTSVFPVRPVLTVFMMLNAAAAAVVIGGNRKSVKSIYNTQQ